MTDDEMHMYIKLKFGGIGQLVSAFRQALRLPPRPSAKWPSPNENDLWSLLKIWIEHGSPEEFDVTENILELTLRVKFGSLKNAYEFWVANGEESEKYLSPLEQKAVIDYTP